jgi:hypothetical protein
LLQSPGALDEKDRGTRACIGRLCGQDTAWTATTSATADTRSAAATGQPADTSPIMFIRAHAHQLVELVHRDGSTVRATMSPSALLRADDSVALASFHDRTEELWLKNR